MALSPADFYAYSRATGAPIPEDPAERAEMAPEVLEFRRNQLKAPSESPNVLQAVGMTALAGAAALGAGLAARRFMRGRTQAPKTAVRAANEGVVQVDLENLRRAASAQIPASEPVNPSRPAPTTTENALQIDPTERLLEELQEMRAATETKQTGRMPSRITRENPRNVRLQATSTATPVSSAEQQLSVGERLRSVNAGMQGAPEEMGGEGISLYSGDLNKDLDLSSPFAQNVFKQAGVTQEEATNYWMGILRSIEEENYEQPLRTTGEEMSNYALARLQGVRPATPALTDIQQSLGQQTQSQFINAVESGEDQVTGRINAQLQRNEDFDFKQGSLTDRLPQDQTQINQAQTFLQEQRQKISAGLTPTRRERALAANPEIAEAAELYASTGDPSVLSRLSETPSSPLTVRPAVQTELKRDELPLGKFYEAKPKFEFTEPLEDKDINLTNKISALGAEQQRVRNRLQEIDEAEPMLRYAMASEGPEGGEYSKMYNTLQYEKSQLPDPESFNADLSDAIEERNFVRRQIQSLEELGPKYELINRQEGVRPFFETTAEGNIIPETLEIRTGRKSVDLGEKSGGGRQFSGYDPETGSKSSVGIYGIEPRNFPIADPGMRPTALLREETKSTLRRKPESGPALQEYIDKTRRMRSATTEQKVSSLQASEALRRATIEGRDPQMVLRNLGFNV